MKKILIFGAGGHAKVIVDIIEKQKEYNIVGFIDEYIDINTNILGYKVLGKISSLNEIIISYKAYGGIIGIGSNSTRSEIRKKIYKTNPDFKFINCIHPNSILGKDTSLGEGNVVMAGVIINSLSTIKNHCILNTNSSVDHDCLIFDFASIAPGVTIGGNVTIGTYSHIGIGSNIFHNVTIGNNCIIGGGSLICENTQENSIYYGSPAKFIKKHKLGDAYLS